LRLAPGQALNAPPTQTGGAFFIVRRIVFAAMPRRIRLAGACRRRGGARRPKSLITCAKPKRWLYYKAFRNPGEKKYADRPQAGAGILSISPGQSQSGMEKTMSLGLIGRKVGMTRIFTAEGDSVPVTVLDVSDNRVTQLKTVATDGYTAVQLAFGKRRPSRVTKPLAGHHAKAGVEAGEVLKEFTVTPEQAGELSNGSVIGVDLFEVGQKVDVQGVSIGKGYAGTIKRYNFASGRASHGNSRSHNVPGSIGMAQDPGRVFPGKRMTGHLGDVTKTVQNLVIARIDAKRKLLLVRGAVPGAKGGKVFIRPAVKARAAKKGAQ
jgi:large subunit ribosomal protein L3